MIPGWIDKLSSGLTGRRTGKPACAPCSGRGAARASFSCGLNLLRACLRSVAAGGVGPALLALLLVPSSALSLSPVQGDLIINSARLSSTSTTPITSSVTVTVVIRTPSVLEFLTHAPQFPGAELVNVSQKTAYRTGSAVTDPFNIDPAPVPVGSAIPLDLSQPLPLTAASQLHLGEPIFIRLTDKDQNLNTTLAETVLVTVSNPTSGDVEVIRLTETGPNTGVFVGYLPTSDSAAKSYDGSLSVSEGNLLTARYVDLQDNSDTSATTLMV